MRYNLTHFFVLIFFLISSPISSSEMTLNELFFDNSKPYHLKILDALPETAIIQIGPDDAKNTVIEFMDYFCGYCKKIHSELIGLANNRNDTRVIFLQHPILSESSTVVAYMVIAANMQNKGFELHNELFSIDGSLNQKKLDEILDKLEINKVKLRIDIGKEEVKNTVSLSSFLANGAGARGTPTLFINEEFVGGYIPINRLEQLLN
ncbi:MAG: hypothetical protein CFH15_00229 [Alphaproteobacteria bacterium MarineAlpha5_Bin5]|nr:MAG: hypothetical protein CFH15_00229 [Alphaproteobacteria bacterium MarineAlpha5_Bin5]|tara:strand:+ start:9625 stop:10245 length:621 start_codon:yes stop_codon:yes gene_type:complete